MNRFLLQQGYLTCNLSELENINHRVKIMPAFCMVVTALGIALNLPVLNFGMLILGVSGFFSKKSHPLDLFVSKVTQAFKGDDFVPSNPLPRRIACITGAFFNLLIGIALVLDMYVLSIILGGILVVLQVIVITTHFCMASWVFEKMSTYLESTANITVQEARELRMRGALLIDVRTPSEYQKKLIAGALNIPFQMLDQHTAFHNKEVIIYCNSGMRSKEAVNIINSRGWAKAYNLGNLKNAISL
ncbi:DUF4395 family protein [Fulvivirga ligni]|uniref:DUF4395 family protein n=1 Tax=Fulvivirga ligni TaxID=2904246 RepID=UPI001F19612D|nr:DUF4395 family protein [Fulvivirga ligni]UII23857.1 rhodanese-like domain-containing protein [Fulvivirga ligni]